MYNECGTCEKCGKTKYTPSVWGSIMPAPKYCGCNRPGIGTGVTGIGTDDFYARGTQTLEKITGVSLKKKTVWMVGRFGGYDVSINGVFDDELAARRFSDGLGYENDVKEFPLNESIQL